MVTKPPSGPQPISTTRAGTAGSQARTNGQFAASQRSSEVTLTDPTPYPRQPQSNDAALTVTTRSAERPFAAPANKKVHTAESERLTRSTWPADARAYQPVRSWGIR